MADIEVLRRQELGTFLRSRRERITPQQIGLAPGGRRRTPGLRREELAQTAGVGVTWYTWLEQGRDINVSAQVMEAVCRALMLDPDERAHAMTLAGLDDHFIAKECQTVAPAVQVMLDQLSPFPASVVNARFDVLAYNDVYSRLIADMERDPSRGSQHAVAWPSPLRSGARPWWIGTTRWRTWWPSTGSNMADHMGDNSRSWKELVAAAERGVTGVRRPLETRRDVQAIENRTKLVMNPAVGLLRLHHTSYWVGPHSGTRVVVYTPLDDEARRRLEKLSLLGAG